MAEFKGICLLLMRQYGIKVINGRPRTPRTQGLVEQANGTVKNKIAAWKREHGSSRWSNSSEVSIQLLSLLSFMFFLLCIGILIYPFTSQIYTYRAPKKGSIWEALVPTPPPPCGRRRTKLTSFPF